MNNSVSGKTSLIISGTLEFKDKDGNIIGTSEMRGDVPLDDLGITVEEAQQLIDTQESMKNG